MIHKRNGGVVRLGVRGVLGVAWVWWVEADGCADGVGVELTLYVCDVFGCGLGGVGTCVGGGVSLSLGV